MIEKNFKTQAEFQDWFPKFRASHIMADAYVVCETFYDHGKLVAISPLTVNIQKYFGFASAIMDYNDIDLFRQQIIDVIIKSENAKPFMNKYFKGYKKSEPGHFNLNVMREIGIKKGKDILIMFYPDVHNLNEPVVSVFEAVCRNAILAQLQDPNYLATFGK